MRTGFEYWHRQEEPHDEHKVCWQYYHDEDILAADLCYLDEDNSGASWTYSYGKGKAAGYIRGSCREFP